MAQEQFQKSEKPAGEAIQQVPDSALASMANEINEAGGEWKGNPEDEGAIGWTAFDSPSSDDGTVTILLPKDTILDLPHQSLVRIKSRSDSRSYLGVVVKGPLAEPDGLRPDAPVVVTATVRGRGNILISQYHGRVQVELIGEELEGGATVPPRRRPLPNSPVFPLSPEETAQVLRTSGDIMLGVAESHDEIEVKVPITKSVFPRHLGILGTTGGGKSTTVSGLIARLQHSDAAVVLLDTEGEYTEIYKPTEDESMRRALKRRGLPLAGVPNTHVLNLVGRETANPEHPSIGQFSLRFSDISPYALKEILDLSEAQEERFFKAYDATKLALTRFKMLNPQQQQVLEDLDELETGYPGMGLAHLHDMVRIIASVIEKEPYPEGIAIPQFRQEDEIMKIITPLRPPGNKISWYALLGRLGRIKRLGIFDNPKAPALDYGAMLRPGHVSIVDLSDTDSPQVNNLVIAQLLRGVHLQQDENYRKAAEEGGHPPLAMVFIEEAHEFLSDERIRKMSVLFQQVARIARRGRKRWLGLCFITQLPQHLPDEVLGLINNWVLHK
ncbi:MAG: ATP-binding protein, partial [Chloroflexi bacterium]|nr:ATP-binding protein [Chloroflexota bacterium]